ncbi:hypothetical protein KGF56_002184 [Candida oxycetoniae]|uniref:Uncharacterized protein n=1 Tax=Candida oxycetoniae TaxID=497107 RepID=A0AAI9SYJ1_9ASCO|nr:uncharacterized protein KGF56_002184 [Candida oxycetoniae]KAI3405019.2 hypothetical protein KGF56_002184 [Candida oxycetoniae]
MSTMVETQQDGKVDSKEMAGPGSGLVQSSGSSSKTKPTNKTPNEGIHRMKKKLIRAPPNRHAIKYRAWLLGHTLNLVFGTITFIFQVFWLPNVFYINSIAYRLTLIGSIIALTATFSHKFGLHFLPPIATLLSHQNFQYIILAVVWCFTFKSVFKVIPYFAISLLQIGKLKKIEIIEKKASLLSSIIAYDELVLIAYLILRTLFFRNASGYQLSLFLIFYWLRILYNPETGNLFATIVDRLDGEVMKIKNPKIQHYWIKTREFVKAKQNEEHEMDKSG